MRLLCAVMAGSMFACVPFKQGGVSKANDTSGLGFSLPIEAAILAKVGPATARLATSTRSFSSPLYVNERTGMASMSFSTDDNGKELLEGESLSGISLQIIRRADMRVVMEGTAVPAYIRELRYGVNDSVAITLKCTAAASDLCQTGDQYEVVPRSLRPFPSSSPTTGLDAADSQLSNPPGGSACNCGPSRGYCLVWNSDTKEVIDGVLGTVQCSESYCQNSFRASTYKVCPGNQIVFVPAAKPSPKPSPKPSQSPSDEPSPSSTPPTVEELFQE
jgi:hypothetical protein